MLFSFSYLLSAFAVVISLSAVALSYPSPSSAGAAYFITNDPTGNQIVAMNIAPDGKLWGITATSTGGRGDRSKIPLTKAGPLDSSSPIQANAVQKIVVTVNAGSNTLVMLKIDPYDPTQLTIVGSPVSSGGEFPVSTAINDEGTMVCVLNAGKINGVNCYRPDWELGLIPIPNTCRSLGLNLTTPSESSGSPSLVAFSEDGNILFVAVKGLFNKATPGFLVAWAIAEDGSLSDKFIKYAVPQGGFVPFSLTPIPGADAILAADPARGFEIFKYGPENSWSANSSGLAIPGQKATCWSSYSSRSGNFYLTDPDTAKVTEVNIDKNLQSVIVRQYQQVANSGPSDNDIASVGDKDFLYVFAPNVSAIEVLDVSTPGNATTVQNFYFGSAVEEVGITPEPAYMLGMTTFVNKDCSYY